MMPKLPQEKQNEIIRMAKEGVSVRQIAKALKVAPATVYTYMHQGECEIKYDCFAWNPTTYQCNALVELVCKKKGDCPFYKPKDRTFETVMIQGGIIGR